MTLPKRDIETVIAFLQHLHSEKMMAVHQLARDAGISETKMYHIVTYGDHPRPGGKVERKLFKYINRIKVEYDRFCPQKVTQK